MDNTKKIKKRFNFIDLLIVLAVLAVAAFVLMLFYGETIKGLIFGLDKDEVYVRYTVTLSAVEDKYVDYIREGSEIYKGDVSLGKIEKVAVSEVERIELNQRTDEIEVVPFPDHKKVAMTVVSKAKPSNGVLLIDKTKISVGSYIEFKTLGFKNFGYITWFESLNEMPEILAEKKLADIEIDNVGTESPQEAPSDGEVQDGGVDADDGGAVNEAVDDGVAVTDGVTA